MILVTGTSTGPGAPLLNPILPVPATVGRRGPTLSSSLTNLPISLLRPTVVHVRVNYRDLVSKYVFQAKTRQTQRKS
jgi:hypothetical protein